MLNYQCECIPIINQPYSGETCVEYEESKNQPRSGETFVENIRI